MGVALYIVGVALYIVGVALYIVGVVLACQLDRGKVNGFLGVGQ